MQTLSEFTDDQLIDELIRRESGDNSPVLIRRYKELEEEVLRLSLKLREAEKGKSEFLSNVRNEINNPLTSILGLAESMSRLTQDERLVRIAELIHLSAFELDFQIRNIVAAAEIESGVMMPSIAKVDILSLIKSQVNYLQPRQQSSLVQIELQSGSQSILPIATDPYLLQVIVVNLLANAIEFSHPHSVVQVCLSQGKNEICIEVIDYGIGIDPLLRKRIFERFHQLQQGTTKEHKGHGLGLAVVMEFVSMLDATIEIDSKPENGTIVKLKIPARAERLSGSSSTGNETMFSDEFLF